MTEEVTATGTIDHSQAEVADAGSEDTGVEFDAYLGSIGDDNKEMLEKNGIDSFEKQFKFINGLNELRGKKGLINPGEGATDEAKSEYRDSLLNELGRPEDGSYDFTLPEGVKDEWATDDFVNSLAELAYQNGMNSDGFQKLIDTIYGAYGQQVQQWEAQMTEINKKLGEDKMDDNAPMQNDNAETMQAKATQLLVDAREAIGNNDYKKASELQNQRRDLLAKIVG